MQCFNGNSSHDIFESLKAQLKAKIAELKTEELDSTDRDAWIDYWENEYYCPLVTIYPNNAELDLNQQTVQPTTVGIKLPGMNRSTLMLRE